MVALQMVEKVGNVAQRDQVLRPLDGPSDRHAVDVDLLKRCVVVGDGPSDRVEHRVADAGRASLGEEIAGEIQQRLGRARG